MAFFLGGGAENIQHYLCALLLERIWLRVPDNLPRIEPRLASSRQTLSSILFLRPSKLSDFYIDFHIAIIHFMNYTTINICPQSL